MSPLVKDKAEILLQVEELLHIKEELSSQVSNGVIKILGTAVWGIWTLICILFLCVFDSKVTILHAALEQERSKVKGLQSEQPKHQVSLQMVCLSVGYLWLQSRNVNKAERTGSCDSRTVTDWCLCTCTSFPLCSRETVAGSSGQVRKVAV